MAASALPVRDPVTVPSDVDPPRLHFASGTGPVVVCAGLTGGAGTSALSALLATRARADGTDAVLAVDAGHGGLAAWVGVASPLGLARISRAVAHGEPLATPVYATAPGGVRVIAGEASAERAELDDRGLAAVLTDAAANHGFTVVDAGTLGETAVTAAARHATHLVWTLRSSAPAVARAHQLLDAIAPPGASRGETLAVLDAQADASERRALQDLAERRGATLLRMPTLDALHRGDLEGATDEGASTLDALAAVLQP